MSYDSPEYINTFVRTGAYPTIHNKIFELIVDCAKETNFLDLCSSTGLLGHRLVATGVAEKVVGVDSDRRAQCLARDSGITIPMVEMRIGLDTLPELSRLIREHKITGVIARRCLPELLGDRPELDAPFVATLADAGIRQLFLEGRVVSARSTNRLAGIEDEIKVVAGRYQPIVRRKACVYLWRIGG
jgi:hypothetical protein